jgi:hypothetical protein
LAGAQGRRCIAAELLREFRRYRSDLAELGENLAQEPDARRHRIAVGFTRQPLELPFDPENLKLLGHQKDATLNIISRQIRLEAEQLRGPNPRIEAERERILADLARREFGDGSDRGKQG